MHFASHSEVQGLPQERSAPQAREHLAAGFPPLLRGGERSKAKTTGAL